MSSLRMSASRMPCRSMFIFEIDQVVPLASWPGESEVGGVAAVFGHVVAGVDEHAARSRARVVDAHALLRVEEAHHERTTERGV